VSSFQLLISIHYNLHNIPWSRFAFRKSLLHGHYQKSSIIIFNYDAVRYGTGTHFLDNSTSVRGHFGPYFGTEVTEDRSKFQFGFCHLRELDHVIGAEKRSRREVYVSGAEIRELSDELSAHTCSVPLVVGVVWWDVSQSTTSSRRRRRRRWTFDRFC